MPLNCSARSAAYTDLSLWIVYSTHSVNSQASSQKVCCSSLTQTSRKNNHLWLDLTVCTDIYGKELPWKNDYGWISWSVYIYMAMSFPVKMIMVGSHGLYVYDKELP